MCIKHATYNDWNLHFRSLTQIGKEERIENFLLGKEKPRQRKGRQFETSSPGDFSLAYENSKYILLIFIPFLTKAQSYMDK